MKIICNQNDAVKLVIITNSSLWGSVLAYSSVTFKVHFIQTVQCRFCTVADHPVISVSAGSSSNRCKLTPDRRRCDVTEGEAVNIRCNSHSNPDPASTRWYKGHPGSSPTGPDSVLRVTSASHVTDNGVYSCQSVTGDLSYSHPPLISTYSLTVLVKCELFSRIFFFYFYDFLFHFDEFCIQI